MFDSAELQAQVRELKDAALRTTSVPERDRLLSEAHAYLLLARNAAWIKSTDEFLEAVNDNRRWPFPPGGGVAT